MALAALLADGRQLSGARQLGGQLQALSNAH
jgi:hypothetical protein